MAQTSPRRLLRLATDQAVVPGKSRQGDLENDFAGALRSAILLLGIFKAFQLAANIDQHAGDLGPTAISARITRLCREHLVAKRRGVEAPLGASAPRVRVPTSLRSRAD